MSKILIDGGRREGGKEGGREAGKVRENSFQVERTVLLLILGSWENNVISYSNSRWQITL